MVQDRLKDRPSLLLIGISFSAFLLQGNILLFGDFFCDVVPLESFESLVELAGRYMNVTTSSVIVVLGVYSNFKLRRSTS